MTPQRRLIVWALVGWFATRIPLYLIMTRHAGPTLDTYGQKSAGDVTLYSHWVHLYLNHRVLPTETNWQYPPLVAPLLMLPQLIPGADYLGSFVRLAFLTDVLITALMFWTATRRGSWLGAWYWIVAVPLLGPLLYGRFDIFSAVFVIGALALLGRGVPTADGRPGREPNGRRWVAGALIGIGAAIKVWPGLMLFGLPRSRRGIQTAAAAIAAGGVVTAASMAVFRNGAGFLSAQGGRGVELESIWAMPFLAGQHLGFWQGVIKYRFGSYEMVGAGVDIAGKVALASTVIGFAALGWWWWRKQWRPSVVADATLVATMIMVVTSRVISPQYMVWLIAVAAFCLLAKDTSQRLSSLILLVSLPLTQLDFPFAFHGLIHAHAGPAALVAVRNVLLIAAMLIGFRSLWRSTVTGPVLPWRRAADATAAASSSAAEIPAPTRPEPDESPAADAAADAAADQAVTAADGDSVAAGAL